MGVYFLDSNALAKRYVLEEGQRWVQALCSPANGHHLYISQMAEIEVVFAICKWTRFNTQSQAVTQKKRKGLLADRDLRVAEFQGHCDSMTGAYRVVIVTPQELKRAAELCHRHNISTLDAIQLACALLIQAEAQRVGFPSPEFVTADKDFTKVIKLYGFTTRNPEDYAEPSERTLPAHALASTSADTWREWFHMLGRLLLRR